MARPVRAASVHITRPDAGCRSAASNASTAASIPARRAAHSPSRNSPRIPRRIDRGMRCCGQRSACFHTASTIARTTSISRSPAATREPWRRPRAHVARPFVRVPRARTGDCPGRARAARRRTLRSLPVLYSRGGRPWSAARADGRRVPARFRLRRAQWNERRGFSFREPNRFDGCISDSLSVEVRRSHPCCTQHCVPGSRARSPPRPTPPRASARPARVAAGRPPSRRRRARARRSGSCGP